MKPHRNHVIVLALVVAAMTPVAAQSNDIIDEILAQEVITYGHAAYLLLSADGTVADDASVTDAHQIIEAGGGESALGYGADAPLTLGEFSLLTMQSFDITGGLAYTLIPRPRYAARELAFRNVIQGTDYPAMDISGERALRIVGRVLALQEEGTLR